MMCQQKNVLNGWSHLEVIYHMNQFSKETGDKLSIHLTVYSYVNTYYVLGSVRTARNTKIDRCDAALSVAKLKG